MAVEVIRRFIFKASGRKDRLEAELGRRTQHLQEITPYGAMHPHPDDQRIKTQLEIRIEEIRNELASHAKNPKQPLL